MGAHFNKPGGRELAAVLILLLAAFLLLTAGALLSSLALLIGGVAALGLTIAVALLLPPPGGSDRYPSCTCGAPYYASPFVHGGSCPIRREAEYLTRRLPD